MIVVTGGAGFIGSNLVAGLNERGIDDVVVCDVLGTGDKWRNIAKREIADVIGPDSLFDYLEDHDSAGSSRWGAVDAVFHLGANSSTTETDVDRIVDQNLAYTLKLWRHCTERKVRLIYASSAATYGDGSHGFDDDSSPAALAALQPLNPYGWSKHAADRRLTRLAREAGLRPPQWAGLKFFNVYGPNEYHKDDMRSVVAKAYEQIVETGRVRLFRSHRPDYTDGGQTRDFVHVDDCVAVMLWLLDHPEVNGLYNMGTGQGRTFADLVGATFRAMDREPAIDFIDMPAQIRDRYQYFTEAKMERLRTAGYEAPFLSLEDGVTRYVRNFLATGDRYL
ncbi:MAG: ADP-glyceromanno-heptose 6-epimerase [Rhodospirillaceae bacterium]|mgnify:CR=1 FL=1|nr:ADP-glyceromanno-heptose 6-epimerase [Rhodospirillaceae bacterium]